MTDGQVMFAVSLTATVNNVTFNIDTWPVHFLVGMGKTARTNPAMIILEEASQKER